MNKKIVAIVLGAVSVFAVAGCNSDKTDKPEIGTAAVEERPEVTTSTTAPAPVVEEETVDYDKLSSCIELSSSITDGLDAMSTGAALLPYVSEADAINFLATAKEFVDTSIAGVQLCADLTPVEAAASLSSLRELGTSIDSLMTVYASTY